MRQVAVAGAGGHPIPAASDSIPRVLIPLARGDQAPIFGQESRQKVLADLSLYTLKPVMFVDTFTPRVLGVCTSTYSRDRDG